MKTHLLVSAVLTLISSQAAIWDINFTTSPGLRGSNENPPNSSPALGGELSDFAGAGITYDDVSRIFNINIGYGSDVGYGAGTDLTGHLDGVHIHQAPAPGANGSIIVDLNQLHDQGQTGPRRTGTISGLTDYRPLSEAEHTALFAGLLYINLHSDPNFPGGEIRGNLVAVPEPETYAVVIGLGLLGLAGYRRFKAVGA